MDSGSWPGGLPKKDGATALSGAGALDTATTHLNGTSRTKNLRIEYNGLLTASKKWTVELPMQRTASWRHVFEANVNGFTLVLQVHGAKPLDDLAQQASVRLG